jgi:PAS domain S-box-containing protein
MPIHVLLIEDNPGDARLVVEMLKGSGEEFFVECAESLSIGLDRLTKQGADVVLLDLSLPKSRGLDTFVSFHAAFPQFPTVILTGLNDEETALQAARLGAQDYLLKGESTAAPLRRAIKYAIERKQAEQTIRRQLSQHAALVSTTSDGYWRFDRKGQLLEVNDTYCQMSGYSRDEILRMHISDFEAVESPIEISDHLRQIIDKGFERFESKHRRKNGETFNVEISITDLRTTSEFLLFVRDITRRKLAETAIQESEREFRCLADFVPQFVWMCKPNGLNIYVNRRWVEYTGLTLEESYGRGWNIPFHPEDKQAAWDAWNQAVTTGDTYRVESRLRAADGTYRWFLMRGMPLRDDSGNIIKWFVTCTDIDDMKREQEAIRNSNLELEQRVQQRTAELVAMNSDLETFNYAVAHDLRGPLRHIDGFAHLLANELTPVMNDASKRHMVKIQKNIQQMLHLLEDLLELARLGRYELREKRCSLNNLVHEVVASLETDFKDRDVEWRIGELPFIDCDSTLMRQVFTNLISNALKFTRTRQPAVIEVDQIVIDGQKVVFVRDNGAGFSMQFADKLFGLFQRLHREEEFEGTGVGLVIVKRIMQRHGGRVWADAELDKGATFYLTFPTCEDDREEVSAINHLSCCHPG